MKERHHINYLSSRIPIHSITLVTPSTFTPPYTINPIPRDTVRVMQQYTALSFCGFLAFGLGVRIPLARDTTPNFGANTNALPHALARRSCGETAALVCYGTDGGMAQELDVDDIAYAAAYLRYLADSDGGDPLWTMPPEFDCSEWTLPLFGAATVMALAKHINPRTNSSVTYYDLARTIDGGTDPTDDELAASLLGSCGAGGGEVAVTVDATDPAYLTDEYVASGAKPQDIIVKLVRDPASQ